VQAVALKSALVHFLNGGEAKPTLTPPRPSVRGVQGRPTLVQNVETLATLGLIARYGADWLRSSGTADEPGPTLATISGAVRLPGVLEVPLGVPISELIERCGGLT
jgi:NADH:ubiquinone oxidoreductase subunit F (NADH-binding)